MNSPEVTNAIIALTLLILLIFPIVILSARQRRFIQLDRAHKSAETERMARSISIALCLYVSLFALSYLPRLLFGDSLLTELSWLVVWIAGLITAFVYDRAAERVTRRLGLTKKEIKAFQSEGCVTHR